MKKKAMALVLALVLVTVGIVGGTMAWLTAQATEVKNVFTDSDINITLTETELGQNNEKSFKMIPGHTITKDPKVTLKAGSEACYLFVQVIEDLGDWQTTATGDSKAFTDYLEYEVATNWTKGNGTDIPVNVYYIKVDSVTSADTDYPILVGDKVKVSGDNVTKTMMDAIDEEDEAKPTLTFKAAAVQLYKTQNEEFTVSEAYAKVTWPNP